MRDCEVYLKSGRLLSIKYKYYAGQLATSSKPAVAPEVVIYQAACQDDPSYVVSDEDYAGVTQYLMWMEQHHDVDY